MASTSAAILGLALSLALAPTDAVTLSAKKQVLPSYHAEVSEKAAPLPPMIEKADANIVATSPVVRVESDTWEDNELDQPGLPPAIQKNPSDSPIVHAKVKQVMSLIQSHREEYSHPKTSQARKDSLLQETLTLSRSHMGTPAFNFKYCLELWGQVEEEAQKAAFYECPALYFPEVSAVGLIPLEQVYNTKPSALRSAYLSEYFWNRMLKNDIDGVIKMMDKKVIMFEENRKVADGIRQVSQKAPYIGWPREADTEPPEKWDCDPSGCIVPIKAFAEKTCKVMAKFNPRGYVEFLSANLYCWR